ncbi:MAG: hypothetical protein L0229_10160 [Blastocatellia bacterium]|nr:hypothetical protein [Blastocatellia bacterium]
MRKDLKLKQAAMRKRWRKPRRNEQVAYNKARVEKADKYSTSKTLIPATPHTSIKSPSRHSKKTDHSLSIGHEVLLLNESPYAESCLPQTMKMAEQSKRLLSRLLRQFPKKWPFADKVLALLAPSFLEDIRDYYSNNGQGMMRMFEGHQLEYLDNLLVRDLTKLLKNIKEYSSSR